MSFPSVIDSRAGASRVLLAGKVDLVARCNACRSISAMRPLYGTRRSPNFGIVGMLARIGLTTAIHMAEIPGKSGASGATGRFRSTGTSRGTESRETEALIPRRPTLRQRGTPLVPARQAGDAGKRPKWGAYGFTSSCTHETGRSIETCECRPLS